MSRLLSRGVVAGLGLGTAAVTTASAYVGVLTAAASLPQRRRATASHDLRIAILVPAHDEEAIIGRTLASFQRLEYAGHVAVHVVADNCTDHTAAIVREAGFTAHERVDPEHPGKGPALNWVLQRVMADDPTIDVVVIIDADSEVEPDFLRGIDLAFAGGAEVVQGYYGVSRPGSSPAAGLRYTALACRHHVRALGRTRIGGSCGLYGNGMAFRPGLLLANPWTGHLVEDAELQNELLLAGTRVTYEPEARLAAEMPDSNAAATTQNQRWELGRMQVARTYLPKHLRRVLTGPSRVAHLDAALDHVVPPLSVVAAAQAVTGTASVLAMLLSRRPAFRVLAAVNAISTIVIFVHAAVGLRAVRAPAAVYRSLLGAPRVIWWKVKLFAGVARKPDEVTWTRTARNDEGSDA